MSVIHVTEYNAKNIGAKHFLKLCCYIGRCDELENSINVM